MARERRAKSGNIFGLFLIAIPVFVLSFLVYSLFNIYQDAAKVYSVSEVITTPGKFVSTQIKIQGVISSSTGSATVTVAESTTQINNSPMSCGNSGSDTLGCGFGRGPIMDTDYSTREISGTTFNLSDTNGTILTVLFVKTPDQLVTNSSVVLTGWVIDKGDGSILFLVNE